MGTVSIAGQSFCERFCPRQVIQAWSSQYGADVDKSRTLAPFLADSLVAPLSDDLVSIHVAILSPGVTLNEAREAAKQD